MEPRAELPFRQSAQFYYLTGVEVPRGILLMDGRAKTSTLYIDPAGFKVRAFGPSLAAGAEAAKITGLDAVLPRDAFADAVQTIGRDNRRVFVAAGADVTGGGSRAEANGLEAATKRDPWDGRATRHEAFVERLRAAAGRTDLVVDNLDPIVDRARSVKSLREIAVIREATRIAGLAIMEAMREAEPGQFEYELQAVAEYAFKKHGAQGPAYFALVATGPNMVYSHYHKGTRKLAAGDLVQFDYAPDYQVLRLGRHARVPGQRKIHAGTARVLRYLSRDVSRADVGDPARCPGPGAAPGGGPEDGRGHPGDDV